MYISRWIGLSWVDTILEIGRLQGRNHWRVGGSGSPTFSLTPNLGQLLTWGMYFCFLWKVDFLKRFPFQLHQIERLEVRNSQNFLGRGAHRAPSPDPSPALSRAWLSIRAFPSNLDSGVAQFGPPNFWSLVAPLVDFMRTDEVRWILSKSFMLMTDALYSYPTIIYFTCALYRIFFSKLWLANIWEKEPPQLFFSDICKSQFQSEPNLRS